MWMDGKTITTYEDCESAYYSLIEQNKRDSSATGILEQVAGLSIANGEFLTLPEGCTLDLNLQLLHFRQVFFAK